MTQVVDAPAEAPAQNGRQLARVEAVDRPLAKTNPPVFRGIELRTFEDMWRMAVAISKSGLAPKGMEKPEQILIALEMGAEVGLAPMASCRSIAVINGRPAIYGDAALALVRASGLLDSFEERIEGSGDERRAVCTCKRRGMPTPRTTSFSVADARKAALWGKSGPWGQYPERMLQFRARGFALRDEFGDVLQGMVTAEEVADYGAPAANEPPQRGVAALVQKIKSPQLDSGQTFEPADDVDTETGEVTAPGRADGDASSAEGVREIHPAQPAPFESPEPDASGADAEPPVDTLAEALAGDWADVRRVLIDSAIPAMSKADAGKAIDQHVLRLGRKGKENSLSMPARRALYAALREGRINLSGQILATA